MKRFIRNTCLIMALMATSACALGTRQPDMSDYAYVPGAATGATVVIEPGIDAF